MTATGSQNCLFIECYLEQLEARRFLSAGLDGNEFTQTNLVSDGSVPAVTIDSDPNLGIKNAWGIAYGPNTFGCAHS